MSKETTKKELVRVQGIDEYTTRMQNFNLSGGHVNAVEYCTTMLGLPTMFSLLNEFNEKNTINI